VKQVSNPIKESNLDNEYEDDEEIIDESYHNGDSEIEDNYDGFAGGANNNKPKDHELSYSQ